MGELDGDGSYSLCDAGHQEAEAFCCCCGHGHVGQNAPVVDYGDAVGQFEQFFQIFRKKQNGGASLPLLASWVGKTLAHAGVEVGRLYTVNTLGAAFGCALAGFLLIGLLGVSTTAYLACATNLLVGATALVLARRAT